MEGTREVVKGVFRAEIRRAQVKVREVDGMNFLRCSLMHLLSKNFHNYPWRAECNGAITGLLPISSL